MNIVKMRPDLWDSPSCTYVGRFRGNLGLGNPFSSSGNSNTALTYVCTKQEALDNYRVWLQRLIDYWQSGLPLLLLDYERIYLQNVIRLAQKISNKQCTTLACHCINSGNYQPVPDGQEQCHAEILYKACLRINSSLAMASNE